MRVMRTSLKILAGALLVTSGLTAVSVLSMQTQFANDQLARLVTRLTSRMAMPVTIEGLTGNILSDMRIANLTIGDRQGTWLSVHNAHVRWHPSVLLRSSGTWVDIITVDHIVMDRVPATEETEKSDTASVPPAVPRWTSLKRFLPGHIRISHILFKDAVTGHQEQELGLASSQRDNLYEILLYTQKGIPTIARLQVGLDTDYPDVRILMKEEAGGVVGRLLTLQDSAGIMASVRLSPSADGIITLAPLFVQADDLTMYGSGQWQTKDNILNGQMVVMAPDLGVLQGMVSQPAAGSLQALLSVQGPLRQLQASLRASSPGIIWSDKTISDMKLNISSVFDARHVQPADLQGQADIKASLLFNDRHVSLDGHLDAQQGLIKANIHHAAYAPYAVSGGGTYHMRDQDFTVQAKTDPLVLHDMLPQTTLQGTLQSTVEAKGSVARFDFQSDHVMETPHGRSTLDVKGQVDQAERRLALDADGLFVHDRQNFKLQSRIEADSSRVTVDTLYADGPGITIDGQGHWDMADALAEGRLKVDIPDLQPLGQLAGMSLQGAVQLDADATAQNKQQIVHAILKKLSIPVGKQSVELQKPATLSIEQKEAHLTPLSVSFSGGSITAQGTANPDAMNATLNAKGLSLHRLVESIPDGRTDIALRLTGTPKSPLVTMTGSSVIKHDEMPVKLTVNGHWRERDLSLQGRVDAQKASVVAKINLDAGLSLMPFASDVGQQTPLQGRVTAHMPLTILDPFLWAGGHRVDGLVDGQAALSGRVGQPQINGSFALKNGRYDHIESGICLRRVNGTMLLSNDAVRLQNMTAHDAANHTLAANLRLALTGAKPFDGAVAMDHFRLFCGGIATGHIDGRVGASGTMEKMQLAGRLTLGPLNVQLPGAQTEADIPSVKIVRRQTRESLPPVVGLNITLTAPNQIFVRGRGLDAEFGGDLSVTGFANRPVISGQFTSRRGSFALLDRALKLNKAELRFAGSIPPSPFLAVDASTKAQNTTITVDLSGPALTPALTLSSNPVLPQDEVLALLLFGRQLQTISPFQAIKLAQAARTLAGLDGGEPGILDKARNALGLDALSVGTADDNSMTISTGKYITDRVYVEVQEGARAEDKQIKTQIELTPAISGNTTIDGNANQGVGLGWRHDY